MLLRSLARVLLAPPRSPTPPTPPRQSYYTGELASIGERWEHDLSPSANPMVMVAVLSTGILSFSLNVTSLLANKATSPLTLCILANVKQVALIGFSTIMFGTEISKMNGLGIVLVVAGSFKYGLEGMKDKAKQEMAQKR
jgi:hypothetical protein